MKQWLMEKRRHLAVVAVLTVVVLLDEPLQSGLLAVLPYLLKLFVL